MGSKRARERRRTSGRAPAILRDAPVASAQVSERPTVAHGTRSGVRFSWRVVSALIVLSMLALLVLFFNTNAFYVHSVAVGGVRTLSKEEVFALSGVADYHLFWVNPREVQANLQRSPSVARAEVRLAWPPQMVQIVIAEREPVLVWEQAGAAVWIDAQGQVMQQREDRPELIRVSYEGLASNPLGVNDSVSTDVVAGALQLRDLAPQITTLRYSQDYGLGYRDPRGWDVWFGIGSDMPNRFLIYNALVENLQSRGIVPNVISVADPEAAYYAVLFGR